jgi:hypothetical protein
MGPLTGIATAACRGVKFIHQQAGRGLERMVCVGGPAFIGTVRVHEGDVDSGAVTGVDLT